MTESTSGPIHAEAREDEPPSPRRRPLIVRLVRLAGFVVVLLAVYALIQVTRVDDPATPPEVGSKAPDFTVRTLDGGQFSLRAHVESDGRPVFLNMWAEWCFPCRAEMPAIDAVAFEHPEIHFLGVVVDDDEAPARSFIEEYEIEYQIGLDDDRVVKKSYVVWAMPSTYLIDSNGVIVERIFGPLREEQLEELLESVG
jgi:thiol-disulfide isomerase/thioredoxin